MNDLISRQQAIDALVNETIYTHEELVEYCEKLITGKNLRANGIYDAIKAIEQLPPAEPKTGKWVDDGDPLMLTCENCGYGVMRYNNTPFCQNCGEKKEVERDG